jgi:hypothetical protein
MPCIVNIIFFPNKKINEYFTERMNRAKTTLPFSSISEVSVKSKIKFASEENIMHFSLLK